MKRFMAQTVIEARKRGYADHFKERSTCRSAGSNGMCVPLERGQPSTHRSREVLLILLLAMINIGRELKEMGLQAHLLLLVHDELVFELPPEEVDILIPVVRSGMENIIELVVPLKVSIEIGRNWNDMESVD